ncbi:cupredoxin domain-containing protein [Candidatus Uhrbacteria bacterium]|nr:cupredoxin domain-containing protein [Candidatus Uhrbacteria bacterium]
MKYLLSLLAMVALAGAGCAQVSTTTDVEADVQAEVSNTEPATEAEEEPVPVEVEVTAEGEAVVTQETNTTVDENGVPVTEVILGEAADVEVDLEVESFSFTPSKITAKAGDVVMVRFSGVQGVHTFTLEEADVEVAATTGESVIFTAPSQPGQYPFYCSIGSHRSMGMQGTLIVE